MFVVILRSLLVFQRLLSKLLCWIPAVKRRLVFENTNLTDPHARSWESSDQLFWAFHCSSEGEFEQVRPLINLCLENDEKVEIIYTSPSVNKRVQDFAAQNAQKVRVLRLPIVNGQSLSTWSKAQGLIMCRYDFFPELLLLPVKKRILVWGSLKGKSPGLWLKSVYKQFNNVVAATELEAKALMGIASVSEAYDFRPAQIKTRLEAAGRDENLTRALDLARSSERLIMGSVWPHDLFLLEELAAKASKLHLWLAPHALDENSLNELAKSWQHMYPQFQLFRWPRNLSDEKAAQLIASVKAQKVAWILEQPGRLLELYPQFTCAYVGGGFGRSIHSVLEPVMAGCWTMCGPKTHRSSEIDLAEQLSPKQIKVVTNAAEFYSGWQEFHARENALKDDNRKDSIHNWQIRANDVARRLLAH